MGIKDTKSQKESTDTKKGVRYGKLFAVNYGKLFACYYGKVLAVYIILPFPAFYKMYQIWYKSVLKEYLVI